MKKLTVFEQVSNAEQFIFLSGAYADPDGCQHVFRKVTDDKGSYAFTMVCRAEKHEVHNINPQEPIMKVRFFPFP